MHNFATIHLTLLVQVSAICFHCSRIQISRTANIKPKIGEQYTVECNVRTPFYISISGVCTKSESDFS